MRNEIRPTPWLLWPTYLIPLLAILAWQSPSDFMWAINWGSDATMKFATAVSLLNIAFSQWIIYKQRSEESPWSLLVAIFCAANIFYVFAVMIAVFVEPPSLHEYISLGDHQEPHPLTVVAGIPSWATATLIFSHLLILFNSAMFRGVVFVLRYVGYATIAVACTAVIGHATGIDLLKFYVPGISTALALPTAVTFLLLARFNFILALNYEACCDD